MRNSFTRYQRDRWFDRVILLLLVLGILLFILYPIVSVITTSFYFRGELTLKNYIELFDARNIILIRNSLWIGIATSTLTLLFALAITIYSFGQGARFKKRMETLLMVTMISPPFVSALAYIILFGRRGLITHSLLGLSINPYGWHGIVILQTLGGISFASLLLLNALGNIDIRHIYAAQDLGAKPGGLTHRGAANALANHPVGVLSPVYLKYRRFWNSHRHRRQLSSWPRKPICRSSPPHLGKAAAISILMLPTAIIAFYYYQSFSQMNLSNLGMSAWKNENYRFPLPKFLSILGLTVGLFFLVMVLKYGNIFCPPYPIPPPGS